MCAAVGEDLLYTGLDDYKSSECAAIDKIIRPTKRRLPPPKCGEGKPDMAPADGSAAVFAFDLGLRRRFGVHLFD